MIVKTKDKNTLVEECLISLSKVGNKFDADDILQEIFIKIYENAKLYTPLGKPMAWIFTIETNFINRFLKSKNRIKSIDEADLKKFNSFTLLMMRLS